MASFYSTYKTLILEAIRDSDVIDAIKNRLLVDIYYEGDNTNNKGWRTVEVYAFGKSKKGNPVIRAFQLRGATDTRVPEWKMFLVDKISQIRATGNSFDTARPKFNSSGDREMIEVWHIVNFNKTVDDQEQKPEQDI